MSHDEEKTVTLAQFVAVIEEVAALVETTKQEENAQPDKNIEVSEAVEKLLASKLTSTNETLLVPAKGTKKQ